MPSNWDKVTLGKIADFRNGLNFTKESFGKGVKVIGVKDFQDYSVPLYDEIEEINPEGVVKEADLLKQGDILFVRSNGNRELIGRSLYINKINEPISHSAFTIRVRFTSPNADPKYFAFLFRSRLIRNILSAYGGGTNISNLNQQILNGLDVPLPPLPTQHRIADILSAYDDLIENNTRRIRILEQMAQAIYQEWFGKVDKESLPKGWELKSFSDLVDIDPATPVDKELEKPFVGMNALSETSMIIDLGLVEMRTGNSGAKFQNRDVLFPRITPSVENGKGAFVQFLNDGQVSIGSTEIIVFREKELNAEYIYFLSREHEFRGNAINSMVGASGRQRVQQECFDSFMVTKPPKKLLEEFANIVSPMFKITHTLALKNANLRQTRDLLLPRLVSGEIDVSSLS